MCLSARPSPLEYSGSSGSPFCGELTHKLLLPKIIQCSAKRRSPGLVNFVPALAYHFRQALPAAFTQPGGHLLARSSTKLKSFRAKSSCNLQGEECWREGAYIPLLPRRSVSLTPSETGGACLSQCESKRRAVATGQENVGYTEVSFILRKT